MTLKQTRKEKYAKLREEIAKENIKNDITDFFTKHSDKVVSVHYRPVVSDLVQGRKNILVLQVRGKFELQLFRD